MDQFLHTVGLAKTRSMAKSWCVKGWVRREGVPLKPSHFVQPGDEWELERGTKIFYIHVKALPQSVHPVPRKKRRCYYEVLKEGTWRGEDVFHEKK